MISEPNCSKRNCRHFQGVKQSDETELTEVVYCSAFPDGIPNEIAYGGNKHTSPYPGDNGIRYERGE